VKAAIIQGRGVVRVDDVPRPKIGPGELLVKMRTCGVCGTDLEKLHGEHITPPVLGHEVAGLIEEVGSGIQNFNVGERVAVHHHISCGTCSLCKNGLETLCDAYPKSNLHPCGLAEYFRVPSSLVEGGTVYKLPDSMSFDEGSQIEPTACCVRALRKVGVTAGHSAVVFGVGPVGLTHIQLLKSYGVAPLYAVDVIKSRREMASKLGAEMVFDPTTDDVPENVASLTFGLGVDYAIVATANPKAFEQGFRAVRKGGVVLLFGAPARGASASLDMSSLFLREVSLQASYSTSETEMRIALKLIEKKRISPSQLISHRFPLSQAVEALNVADKAADAVKVIVENK
jgi:L-iditol 2-dehydrogenase